MKCPNCNHTIPRKLIFAETGRLAGRKNAKRGPEYFREIAAKRKTFAGGRPKKEITKHAE